MPKLYHLRLNLNLYPTQPSVYTKRSCQKFTTLDSTQTCTQHNPMSQGYIAGITCQLGQSGEKHTNDRLVDEPVAHENLGGKHFGW